MNLSKYVRQILRASLRQIKCALTGHEVSIIDEDKLFASQEAYIETICERCHYPLLLRRDPSDKEGNYYMLMER